MTSKKSSIRGIMRSKVMNVAGFKLESFHKRIVKDNRWLEVHTREGKCPDDEWIEIMGGTLDGSGKHFRQGLNKDMTNRFNCRRGAVHASRYFADNVLTRERLDEDEVKGGLGEYTSIVRTHSGKITKTVRIVEVNLVRTDSVS